MESSRQPWDPTWSHGRTEDERKDNGNCWAGGGRFDDASCSRVMQASLGTTIEMDIFVSATCVESRARWCLCYLEVEWFAALHADKANKMESIRVQGEWGGALPVAPSYIYQQQRVMMCSSRRGQMSVTEDEGFVLYPLCPAIWRHGRALDWLVGVG